MRIAQDAAFRRERERFTLRFTCEHCSLYDPEAAGCAHGYPTVEHRDARYASPNAVLVFCKEFELL